MNLPKLFNKKLAAMIFAASLISACGDPDSGSSSAQQTNKINVDLDLPESLTGNRVSLRTANNENDVPCTYLVPEEDNDPFRNGYVTTRFMISTMATWTCLADFLIDIADFIEQHDGMILETDNDTMAANYDRDDPTHYSITDDSEEQVTVRMYYDFDRANPPTSTDTPSFYISWIETTEGNVDGKMIVAAEAIDSDIDEDDPVLMRLDFQFDQLERSADMYLQFSEENDWANGFRIQVTKDLRASPLGQVFTARGLINMTGQYFPAASITEIPQIRFFTVSDLIGNGAAIQLVNNFSLPLILNANLDNSLGDYLFSKEDVYYFDDDQDWEYINKTVINSSLRGGRTTAATGGSWLPFDPSQDMIISALNLDSNYFSGNLCAVENDNCDDLLNAIFIDGFAGQEQNQGSNPEDWRTTALENAEYLQSVFPNGTNWDGAFEQSFSPAE